MSQPERSDTPLQRYRDLAFDLRGAAERNRSIGRDNTAALFEQAADALLTMQSETARIQKADLRCQEEEMSRSCQFPHCLCKPMRLSVQSAAPSSDDKAQREWEGRCSAEVEEAIKEIDRIYCAGSGRDWGMMRDIAQTVVFYRESVARSAFARSAPHCQNGTGDVCLASKVDGITCPDDSCDIDDGIRKAPQSATGRSLNERRAWDADVLKDAERYRFLKSFGEGHFFEVQRPDPSDPDTIDKIPVSGGCEMLDDVIDEAMRATDSRRPTDG